MVVGECSAWFKVGPNLRNPITNPAGGRAIARLKKEHKTAKSRAVSILGILGSRSWAVKRGERPSRVESTHAPPPDGCPGAPRPLASDPRGHSGRSRRVRFAARKG